MRARIAFVAFMLPASVLVGTAVQEKLVLDAMIPVKGDKWTLGYGDTTGEDGKGVKPGDRTTPERALLKLHDQMSNTYLKPIKACITNNVSSNEGGSLIDAAINAGPGAVCRDLAPMWNAARTEEDYKAACEFFIGWRETVKGRSCRDRKNGCYGLVKRRQYERDLCLTPDGTPLPRLP